MSSSSGRSHRSSISPFRSRKSPAQPPPPKRPLTPSSTTSSSSRPPSRLSVSLSNQTAFDRTENAKAKENVMVTVRFRPLSAREISKGDEIAWYADGNNAVVNEYNPSIAYGFDRVFGPATTTRHVYDVAAQHVVSGAMQGINGTVLAYGVTSSGKTHTMHGEQKSPGIIPLAVKDVFGIIQETPGREFLLRVSYLEIYNEVINDLLDPTGQNLRIREDAQGTYVEGIKEEVVLSPAHALSLIATGEEHRHVGSNNFNLLSSRSHTIFTLTIESSPCGENLGDDDVTLAQLNLIDLAGSESSKTETTGLRRKEGSYINKSLLTLGTVISKLTDGKSTHIPYRDSKLTRLLQSSLSGHGHISLICTVTPASGNSEETHNTLKFAHRSKHVEIKASQNKIMDEKSLIKKYQKEISCLKEELHQLKRGILENPHIAASNQDDLINLKLQLEAGQVKLQSRLEEEEEAKEALMGRIQRLTKLILVSTKNSMQPSVPDRPGHRRRHSFGEDELAYLPERKREFMLEEDTGSELSIEGREEVTNIYELVKDYRRNRKKGMLNWFKLKKPDSQVGSTTSADSGSSASGSPASASKSSQTRVAFTDVKESHRKSMSRTGDDCTLMESLTERTQAGDLFSVTVGRQRLPPTGTTITDQMDLLREQMKMLAGEVALCTSSLKRMSEQAVNNPDNYQLKEQMQKLKDEISEKKRQMHVLEKRMIGSIESSPHAANNYEMSQALSKLTAQMNEKTFELEIKSADNRILQEQLQTKISENSELQETILLLRQQLSSLSEKISHQHIYVESDNTSNRLCSETLLGKQKDDKKETWPDEETLIDENTPKSVMSLNRVFSQDDSRECNAAAFLNSQVHMQAAEIENLKQEKVKLIEEKDGLEIHSKKLEEEASYAKELAAAAAVELRNLAEEVTRLSYENAKLTGDLAAAKDGHCKANFSQRPVSYESKQNNHNGSRFDGRSRKQEGSILVDELQKELNASYQREAVLSAALSEKDRIGDELQGRLDEAKRREQDMENELANLWMQIASMKKSNVNGNFFEDMQSERVLKTFQVGYGNGFLPSNDHTHRLSKDESCENMDEIHTIDQLKVNYQKESRRCKELESLVLRLQGDDIGGLAIKDLEELQNFHVEAITKICQEKYKNHV